MTEYQAIVLPRHLAPDIAFTDDALALAGQDLMERGAMEVTDLQGRKYNVWVTNVTITPRGLEATFDLAI